MKGFLYISKYLLPFLIAICIFGFSFSFYLSSQIAPSDFQQGENYRMIFIHVPAAWLSMFCYTLVGFYSALYIIFRNFLMDILALVNAFIGIVFTVITLLTGCLWGYPVWGTYWVWDARLVSFLVLFFLYIGYLLLRKFLAVDGFKPHISVPIIGVLGLINIPIIRMSVEWWSTLHQGASLTKFGSSLDIVMLFPMLSFAITFLFFTWLVAIYCFRYYYLKLQYNLI
jgi:heme exporter protein C